MNFREKIEDAIARVPDGWCTVTKAMAMCDLILEHRPATVVELGIFAGKSIIPLGIACREVNCGKVYGFDPWSVEAALEGENSPENDLWWSGQSSKLDLDRVYVRFAEQVFIMGLLPWIQFYRMKGEHAVNLFEDGTVDMLHQDSNHSELVSCRQVDLWRPKVRIGGFWIMDDAAWATQAAAVAKLKQFCDLITSYDKDGESWMIFRKRS